MVVVLVTPVHSRDTVLVTLEMLDSVVDWVFSASPANQLPALRSSRVDITCCRHFLWKSLIWKVLVMKIPATTTRMPVATITSVNVNPDWLEASRERSDLELLFMV